MEKVKVIKIGNKSLVPIDKITSIAVHSKHIILYSNTQNTSTLLRLIQIF